MSFLVFGGDANWDDSLAQLSQKTEASTKKWLRLVRICKRHFPKVKAIKVIASETFPFTNGSSLAFPTQSFPVADREPRSCKPRADWLSEIKKANNLRASLLRRREKAERAGNQKKLADLGKQYEALVLPEFWWRTNPEPAWPETMRYVTLITRDYGRLSGLMTEAESKRLWKENGRTDWESHSYWRLASEREKENLKEKLWEKGDYASLALADMLRRLERVGEDGESFSMFTRLIVYRFSLNWSLSPGKARHTLAEIKQIVDPGSVNHGSTGDGSFRNQVNNLKIPYVHIKTGRGSPYCKDRAR